jgi:hypothetical protein
VSEPREQAGERDGLKVPTLGARVLLTQLTLQQEVATVVGMEGCLDIVDLWRRGRSISEIARQTGHDRKAGRRRSIFPAPALAEIGAEVE